MTVAAILSIILQLAAALPQVESVILSIKGQLVQFSTGVTTVAEVQKILDDAVARGLPALTFPVSAA